MRNSGRALLFFGLLSAVGCASPPEMARTRARTALSHAEAAQAELYAPARLKAGRSQIESAETEMVIQLSRPRPFRRFSEAQLRFQKAEAALRAAAEESVNRQNEYRVQAEDTLREFDQTASQMEKQLTELRAKFVEEKQIDRFLHELNALRAEVPAIHAKINSADYPSAYHAASNLRARESLLDQEAYDLVEKRMVASIH